MTLVIMCPPKIRTEPKKNCPRVFFKTIRTVFLFCGIFLFRIHGKTDVFLLEFLEHRHAVLLSVVYETAVPVFEGGKKGISAVVVIRFLRPE